MGKKYIIEIPEDKITDFVGSTHFLMPYIMAGHIGHHDTGLPIEPYTEPDLEQVRKEAYQKGFKDAAHNCEETCTLVANARNEGYNEGQRAGERHGKEVAWATARKIQYAGGNLSWWIHNTTASEAIEGLNALEQEKEAIKVGNEVEAPEMKPFIVTGFGYGDNEEDVYCHGFVTENGISTSAKKNSCVRTGRHFPELAAVLEKMMNESNAQINT